LQLRCPQLNGVANLNIEQRQQARIDPHLTGLRAALARLPIAGKLTERLLRNHHFAAQWVAAIDRLNCRQMHLFTGVDH
jgi:hypothetical protein